MKPDIAGAECLVVAFNAPHLDQKETMFSAQQWLLITRGAVKISLHKSGSKAGRCDANRPPQKLNVGSMAHCLTLVDLNAGRLFCFLSTERLQRGSLICFKHLPLAKRHSEPLPLSLHLQQNIAFNSQTLQACSFPCVSFISFVILSWALASLKRMPLSLSISLLSLLSSLYSSSVAAACICASGTLEL